jgi:hypothetical protein
MASIVKVADMMYVNDVLVKDKTLTFNDPDQIITGYDLSRDRAKIFRNPAFADYVAGVLDGKKIDIPFS